MKKSEIKWNQYLKALRKFSEAKGHTAVPASYKAEVDGTTLKLGNWVGYIRSRGRSGKLPADRVAELSAIAEWTWDTRRPGPRGNPGRDMKIAIARRDGRSLQSIALEWNLSRQRVHQIVRRLEASVK